MVNLLGIIRYSGRSKFGLDPWDIAEIAYEDYLQEADRVIAHEEFIMTGSLKPKSSEPIARDPIFSLPLVVKRFHL